MKHSEETKLKMSAAAKVRTRKPFSDEARKNMSKARTGEKRKPLSDETKAKMSASKLKYWAKKKEL